MCVPLFHIENDFHCIFWKDLLLENYVMVDPEYGVLVCLFYSIEVKSHRMKQLGRGGVGPLTQWPHPGGLTESVLKTCCIS